MMAKRTPLRPGIRQAKILDLVGRRGEVRVEDLAKKFDTSPETIRRDLTILANGGKLQKIHGGARAPSSHSEGVFDVRMRRNALAKRTIAEKAASVVEVGQTIFMDTGSTTLICAEALARKKELTVITNSTRIASTFAAGSGGAEIYLLGGLFRGDNAQTVGASTICEIANYRADKAIITIGALDVDGVMDFSNQEAQVARAMIGASAQVVILADHSKLNRATSFKVCDLSDVDLLVSDKAPTDALKKTLLNAEVEVL